MTRHKIATRRFGDVDFDESELLHFPGLPGFPEAKRFLVRHHDRETPLAWMISADVPELSFVVTDPWTFVPDYRPVLEPQDWQCLGVTDADSLQILVIAKPTADAVALNLAAPLLIGLTKRLGRQAILRDRQYETQHLVRWAPGQTESKPQR